MPEKDHARHRAPVARPNGEFEHGSEAAGVVGNAKYWADLYHSRDTGWDLAGPTPVFVDYFKKTDAPMPPARVIVPGCGKGHDALNLAARGFEVLAVDFAGPALAAVRRARRKLHIPPQKCRTLRADILNFPERYHQQFDFWLEYTCFCAIDPRKRLQYVKTAAAVLKPGGLIVGIFYPFRAKAPGPPFAVSEAEIESLFGPWFQMIRCEQPANSIERRRGAERFIILKRNSS